MNEVECLLSDVRTRPPSCRSRHDVSLVDFHCHLDLYPDFADMVRECETRHVLTLAVTTTPQAWPRNQELASATKHVRAALGLHPQLVGERWREVDLWLRLLPETRYVGEVGLDAGPAHYRTLDRQKDVFRTVLQACAAEGGRSPFDNFDRAGDV